jgi:hypothetical protein
MKPFKLGAAIAGILLFGAVPNTGCVADRPARNGVFNENQYIRKDFLIQGTDANGDAAGTDPGWLVRATVMETSTPNLMGPNMNVWGGAQSAINLVRFRVTQDKLQLLSMAQLSAPVNPAGIPDETGVTAAVVNAWPATNVDLKYRVNLDGETTNFYEENQELDWQVRQWVKLQFDKNDFSDLQPLGPETWNLIMQCSDLDSVSATLVDGSFIMEGEEDSDPTNDYMEFTVQVSIPMTVGNAVCNTAYGPTLLSANLLSTGDSNPRTNSNVVTANLKYSFKRATPLSGVTYKPWIMAEKDPIQRKYGPFLPTVFNRDNATGLLTANEFVGRFDPTQPIVWYFDQTFPENYKCIFRSGAGCPALTSENGPAPVTIEDGTNALLQAAGAKARLSFLDYNAPDPVTKVATNRTFGDIRYNFLRWESDQDVQASFVAVTMPGFDPRTGQIINEGIMFNDFAIKDQFVTRVDAFLTSIGDGLSDFAPSKCTPGQTLPLVNATVIANHNAFSTLYGKMQAYLAPSAPPGSHLGPADFVPTAAEDADFLQAYFTLAPYELFADPAMNQFVTPEGGTGVYGPADVWQHLQDETTFQQLAATIDSGQQPFQAGVANSVAFVNQMRNVTRSHDNLTYMKNFIYPAQYKDALGAFSFETVMQHDARRCVNGSYETAQQWEQGLIDAYWQQTFWHEFGHAMGLEHNFMGSMDQPNFTPLTDPTGKNVLKDANGNTEYALYSSSIMDYFANPADGFWTQGWGKYDAAAIAWIYANNGSHAGTDKAKDQLILAKKPLSGQADATYPYADPLGFCGAGDPVCTEGNERVFLRCDEHHLKYSPMCRQFDLGVTPSQIIANAIDDYEWQFPWRNFRSYHKVWDLTNYASSVENTIVELRRFLSQWYYDWSPGDLTTVLHRIGVVQPVSAGAVSANDYYTQLTNKFLTEMSAANEMMAAFHEAIIQQASGERPYVTAFDQFYGDELQQGIILDKYFAMQEFVGLWLGDNYDQNQAAGAYLSSWGSFDFDFPSQTGTGTPFDNSYESVAETSVTSMIGSQYAVYPYFIPTAVALFAQDTHNPAFLDANEPGTRVEAKEWIGGWTFTREQDMIDFFRNIAVQANGPTGVPAGCDPTLVYPAANSCVPACLSIDTCAYDPTNAAQVTLDVNDGHFVAPDGLTYVWAYLPERAQWIVARQDRNIVTWKVITNYNSDLLTEKDDGSMNNTYDLEYQIMYTIDAYNAYEYNQADSTMSAASASASGG